MAIERVSTLCLGEHQLVLERCEKKRAGELARSPVPHIYREYGHRAWASLFVSYTAEVWSESQYLQDTTISQATEMVLGLIPSHHLTLQLYFGKYTSPTRFGIILSHSTKSEDSTERLP